MNTTQKVGWLSERPKLPRLNFLCSVAISKSCLAFDGIVDFDRVAKRLAKLGFTDTLTCEMTTASKPGRNTHDIYADLSCEEYLARVMIAMKRLGEMVETYRCNSIK